ncbi:hypothetical protein BAE44_0026147 [Dichanthelium oligosanthes]|uniref:Uncharacterized protein n=1 Tax=Dichanthelium oligosanthes TaxID=888268 RepID=A0A1E5UJ40_9POAL|nr:hypothetical protein BAE44_0026147 [Dichanthelium oligosanthes]
MLTCLSVAVTAAHGAKKGRWTGEIKRKILTSLRRERIRAVKDEPCDVEKQTAPEGNAAEQQTTTQRLRPALKRGRSPRDGGSPEAIAVAINGTRNRKGLRVRFDLPAEETISAAPVEPPRFPKGVLGQPPESFAHSGPEMTAAFLASVVTAADADSATPIDRELVTRWTERKETCSRRLRYLRDYCPFQREEDKDEEDEESAPETTATLPPESDYAEEALPPVKTGLPFDSPESEAEFVNAIYSRYLLKDDSISRYA